MTNIKTELQGEIDPDINVDINKPQFTCPINGETVFGISGCPECDGYEMCTADKYNEFLRGN